MNLLHDLVLRGKIELERANVIEHSLALSKLTKLIAWRGDKELALDELRIISEIKLI